MACKNDEITPSKFQTKIWRKIQTWYKNGKKTECEKYQVKNIEKIIGTNISKTNMRFNKETNTFTKMTNPNTEENGFEWTEDMDGIYEILGIKYYINFKMVCDKGGAQTRSLREVYEFIKAQAYWLLANKEEPILFINILDGDESFRNRNKFQYLDKYKNGLFVPIKDKIFIGDLYEFNIWWSSRQ